MRFAILVWFEENVPSALKGFAMDSREKGSRYHDRKKEFERN
jgi:hypothetical protein